MTGPSRSNQLQVFTHSRVFPRISLCKKYVTAMPVLCYCTSTWQLALCSLITKSFAISLARLLHGEQNVRPQMQRLERKLKCGNVVESWHLRCKPDTYYKEFLLISREKYCVQLDIVDKKYNIWFKDLGSLSCNILGSGYATDVEK